MHVHIAGPTEQPVFEMMMFQVRDAVRHVGLAGEERLLPKRLAIANHAAHASHVGRQIAGQQLRSQGRVAQLGMRKPQVVTTLRDVIGELVGETEAQTPRVAAASIT